MKILIVGSVPTEQAPALSYQRTFSALGHEVEIVDNSLFYKQAFWNRILNKFVRIPIYFGVKRLNDAILSRAKIFKPEMILFLEQRQIKPETLRAIKNLTGAVLFARNDDAVFRAKNLSTLFMKTLGVYDCIISMNSQNVTELKRVGAKRAEFVPLAVDQAIEYPVEPANNEEKIRVGADVIFIGTYANEDRVGYLERLCEEGCDIKIYGNGWRRAKGVRCLRGSGSIMYKPVIGEEMSKVINSSKIIIAFLRHHNRDQQTVRTYEIPACRGFMLHERTPEATELFKEGVEAAFFSSYAEFRDKIKYYLVHDEERERIREAGYLRSKAQDYSYADRAEKILKIYGEIKNKR
ncbi:MAG: hypothetical protein LiPW15_541 [Parcubacteria group bacterium LiPW_15]|nr:MAG: hypothetical protein LiPW15_541 [Parcubacteria group bacterium LiPW_15]